MRKKGTPYNRKYTEEMIAFIRKRIKGKLVTEIVDPFNIKFKTNITASTFRSIKKNYKITSGVITRFGKHINSNFKGQIKKGIRVSVATEFKKGNRPMNTMKAGTEVVRPDGYVWVKVSDPNIWKQKHRIVYEEKHGKMPEEHILIFLDQDKLNISIENLRLVSRSELLILNRRRLIYKNSELTMSGAMLASLIDSANKKRRLLNEK